MEHSEIMYIPHLNSKAVLEAFMVIDTEVKITKTELNEAKEEIRNLKMDKNGCIT